MFFFLSKVLSFLIDPFFWIIVMFLISIFHYKKYLRRSFLILGISMILFFSNSLIFNYVNDLWSVKNINEKEHYQIGILLGGMISLTSSEENIQFSNHNDRLLNTLDLFNSKKIDKILITGAAGSLSSDLKESQILKKYLNKVGIPDSCILIEDKSKNTFENAIYCEKILLNSNFSEDIILKAQKSLEKDFQPIDDMRASKNYRIAIAKNLLTKCFAEIKKNKLIRLNY